MNSVSVMADSLSTDSAVVYSAPTKDVQITGQFVHKRPIHVCVCVYEFRSTYGG